jgi:alpha-beta hydrolase superfamily lysophospholipase
VLSACTGSDAGAESTARSSAPVAFKDCTQIDCEGALAGARYRIVLPARWNGTLLLYSHGYRFAAPVPPDFAAPATDAVPAPGEKLADDLLARGFALAGSSWSQNGWAVPQGVAADEALYAHFAKAVGTPKRVYLWGDSLGGLVTQTLAEKGHEWVSGVAPLCGVLGGTNENLDLALDVSYAVRELLVPGLQLTGYRSHASAVREWQRAQRAVVTAAATGGMSAAPLALVSALVDAPAQTSQFDGSTQSSRTGAAAESILTGLGYGTYGRFDIEHRVGGNPSSNTDADYAARVSTDERARIDELGGSGTTDRLLAALARGRRVAAKPSARAAADRLGDPTGNLQVPTVTLHTTADPLVLVQNERLFADRVSRAGRSGDLLQLYVAPPESYAAPAPYGAGHCAFTDAQREAAVDVLDAWVVAGRRPDSARLADLLYDARGISTGYVAPGWPS